jgi:hypothetical protein
MVGLALGKERSLTSAPALGRATSSMILSRTTDNRQQAEVNTVRASSTACQCYTIYVAEVISHAAQRFGCNDEWTRGNVCYLADLVINIAHLSRHRSDTDEHP